MQTTMVSSAASAAVAASDVALQEQIAALRGSLKAHRMRARKLWDACAPESKENSGEAKLALGQFTAKYLKRQADAVYS